MTPPNISPRGLVLENSVLKYKVKQRKNGKIPSNYKLAWSILNRKFPSVNKPLPMQAPPKISPQKGPLENRSPGAYFPYFTVS